MSFGEIAGIALCIFLLLMLGIVFGTRIDNIMSDKGYSKSWFWRGFFLWPFIYRGILRAQVVNEIANIPYDEKDTKSRIFNEEPTIEKMTPDSWQCMRCKRWNRQHISLCKCGNSKEYNKKMIARLAGETQKPEEPAKIMLDGVSLTSLEQSLVNLIAKNPEGISGINITKAVPKTVLSEQLNEALEHICELDIAEQLDNGYYKIE